MSEQLDRPVRPRALEAAVANLRLAAAADDAANERIAGPRIDAVLTACSLVTGELEGHHSRFIDTTDLDPTGHSRNAALWLLAGRILGLNRALLVQIRAGICNEALVTARAMHEASVVLSSFSVPDASRTVRTFLKDQGKHGYVKQDDAHKVNAHFERKLATAMKAKGLPPIHSSREVSEELYDQMSRAGHNRRSSCLDSYWDEARVMAYGHHPSAVRRAEYARWAVSMTVATVNAVGDALRALYGTGDWFSKVCVPLIKALEAVEADNPLDESAIRAAAERLV